MKYSCGGMVALTTPCSTLPGWVRQASGVGVSVGGTGLGVRVAVGVGVGVGGGEVYVGVGEASIEEEQAESPRRSEIKMIIGNA